MGIEEMALDRARKEGLEKGKAEGKVEGKAEGKTEEVKNLITKMGLSDAQVAGVSTDFVKKVRMCFNTEGYLNF